MRWRRVVSGVALGAACWWALHEHRDRPFETLDDFARRCRRTGLGAAVRVLRLAPSSVQLVAMDSLVTADVDDLIHSRGLSLLMELAESDDYCVRDRAVTGLRQLVRQDVAAAFVGDRAGLAFHRSVVRCRDADSWFFSRLASGAGRVPSAVAYGGSHGSAREQHIDMLYRLLDLVSRGLREQSLSFVNHYAKALFAIEMLDLQQQQVRLASGIEATFSPNDELRFEGAFVYHAIKAIGYALDGDERSQRLFVLHGGIELLRDMAEGERNLRLLGAIARTVANACLREASHERVLESGLLVYLADWARICATNARDGVARPWDPQAEGHLWEEIRRNIAPPAAEYSPTAVEEEGSAGDVDEDPDEVADQPVVVELDSARALGAAETAVEEETTALKLQGHAVRALCNFENQPAKYRDGVVLLYPIFRADGVRHGEPEADIVFVHGLKGCPYKTWRVAHSKITTPLEVQLVCWPKSWLPLDLPDTRIVSLDYSASIAGPDSSQSLPERAAVLGERLERAAIGAQPMVFVTHSMGGLVTKQLLLDNSEMAAQTRAVLFFSTPHSGSPITVVRSAIPSVLYSPSATVKDLIYKSAHLEELNRRFGELAESKAYEVLSLGECLPTKLSAVYKPVIVPPDSSNPGYGRFLALDTDHMGICKPSGRDDARYAVVVGTARRAIGWGGRLRDRDRG